ncbi:hypothetical protein Cme02nite_65030 [Catellatospora methionotrophica]|uniref:Uncharacterized protein n=1 Tax=Catellatospora methionotrophica TaxID=121620 RepID=A0A8J3LMR7_9ACTN|nr:hypothetical protein [Catellatospora methionotrophica]GIG18171.1 hypothetical protein Cme02nite_65030 [Catellatospora methionotrophica]
MLAWAVVAGYVLLMGAGLGAGDFRLVAAGAALPMLWVSAAIAGLLRGRFAH